MKNQKKDGESLKFVLTPNSLILLHTSTDGKQTKVALSASDPGFIPYRDMIRENDRAGIVARMTAGTAATIPAYSGGRFSIDVEAKRVLDTETGESIDGRLAARVLDWHARGLPCEPLLRFHARTVGNPSRESVADLYAFMEANCIPITTDGMFIAYKKVTRIGDALLDSYSKTISNMVGTKVSIDRSKVDPNRRNTCSTGLHVGGWPYVSNFDGNVTLEVVVDPADVVAVPPDYNQQKMRVCSYFVLREMGREDQPHKDHMVVVKTGIMVPGDTVKAPDFNTMTAQAIKNFVHREYGVAILTDNKNKRAIVKAAYAAFAKHHGE